jgi:hypothetical protein
MSSGVRACKGLGSSHSSNQSRNQSRKWINQRKATSNEDQWRQTNVQQRRNEVWQGAIQSLENMNEPSERDLIKILDNLSTIPYPDSTVDDLTAVELLMRLTKYIHVSDLVASKLCQLLTLLIGRQKLSQFKKEQGEQLISIIVSVIQKAQTWLLVDALRTLGYIIALSSVQISDQVRLTILNVALPNAHPSVSDLSVKYYALNCLEKVLNDSQILSTYSSALFNCLFYNLMILSKLISKDSYVEKHMNIIIKCLSIIVQHGEKIHVPFVNDLVLTLKRLSFYGTVYNPAQPLKKERDRINCFTSESDLSDSEQSTGSRSAIRIRLQALQLLSEMTKKDFKSIFGEFKNLIPESNSTHPHPKEGNSLCTIILYDHSPRCRSAACQLLISMLENSKPYLAQADDTKTKSAFVPFSRSLAFMINELHVTLLAAIEQEKASPTLLYLVKCLCTLIGSTPYEKLSMRFMKKITASMLHLIKSSSERAIQNIAFHCLASVFGTSRPLKEVEQFLSEREPIVSLIEYMDSPYSILIRTECAQVMLNIAKNYPHPIENYWSLIYQIVYRGLSHSDQTLRLLLVQIINNYTAPFPEMPPITSSLSSPNSEAIIPRSLIKPIPSSIWIQILENIVLIALNDEFPSIRATACLIYANLDEKRFSELADFNQKEIIDKLFEAIEDPVPSVKATACRAIGVIVTFCFFRENMQFLQSVFTHLKLLLSDKVLNVRNRAYWSIANICDTIRQSTCCQNMKEDDIEVKNFLTDLILVNLNACIDNDKIVSNSVRALGNIGQVVPLFILETKIFRGMKKGIYLTELLDSTDSLTTFIEISLEDAILIELVACIKSVERTVKPRWNSCYALGNLLRNKYLSTSVKQALSCLCEVIQSDKNFKVRIQASLALSTVNDYGEMFATVFNALLSPFLKSESRYQYREYKYVAILKEQAQKGLCHLINCASEEHLKSLLAQFCENAVITSSIIADTLNQPGCYELSLSALQKFIYILESVQSTNLYVEQQASVQKALAILKKKLEFEQKIQENSLFATDA